MRRRAEQVERDGVMPVELRRQPVTSEEFAYWLAGDEMPADWDLGGEVWWRHMTAHTRWSRARAAWRREYDPSDWWYWRSRDLPVPPRSQRESRGETDGVA